MQLADIWTGILAMIIMIGGVIVSATFDAWAARDTRELDALDSGTRDAICAAAAFRLVTGSFDNVPEPRRREIVPAVRAQRDSIAALADWEIVCGLLCEQGIVDRDYKLFEADLPAAADALLGWLETRSTRGSRHDGLGGQSGNLDA